MGTSDRNQSLLVGAGVATFAVFAIVLFWVNLWYGLILLLLGAIPFYFYQKRVRTRNALELEGKLMPEIAAGLGTCLSATSSELSFEREGQVFRAAIKYYSLPDGPSAADISSTFRMPGIILQQFTIKNSPPFERNYPDLPVVAVAEAPRGFSFHSRDAEYLQNLLALPHVMDDVSAYPDGLANGFGIIFVGGKFEVTWRVCSMSDETEPALIAKKVNRVCQTAIVFSDAIKTLGHSAPLASTSTN